MTRRKVVFIINSLAGGGAERIMSRLLGLLEDRARSNEFHLVLLDRQAIAYPIANSVTVHQLDCRGSFWRSVTQLRALLRTLRPSVTLSFLTRANIANGLVRAGHRYPRIMSERINTNAHLGNDLRAKVVRLLIRLAYRRADRIIAVSPAVADELADDYGLRAEKIVAIPNPVDVDAIKVAGAALPSVSLPANFVATVGRLTHSKNHAMLLRAFAQSGIAGDLVIAGEGPLCDDLAKLADSLGIRARTHFLGFVDNPYSVVARAQLYVQCSNVEGFPNALVEAMALDVPVIATNCPDGPAEILAGKPRQEISGTVKTPAGLLIPCGDIDALGEGLKEMVDNHERRAMIAAAQERLKAFAPQRVADRYWQIIEGAMANALDHPV